MNAQDEFDLSDAGIQPLDGAVATITDYDVVEKDNGDIAHEVTFSIEGLNFPVTKSYWYKHSNPKAVQAGRGQLKRIAKAAIGQTAYSRTSLIGAKVLLNVKEDDSGFAQLSKIVALPTV